MFATEQTTGVFGSKLAKLYKLNALVTSNMKITFQYVPTSQVLVYTLCNYAEDFQKVCLNLTKYVKILQP